MIMVFDASFNNVSVKLVITLRLWKTTLPGENHIPAASHIYTYIQIWVRIVLIIQFQRSSMRVNLVNKFMKEKENKTVAKNTIMRALKWYQYQIMHYMC